MSSRSVKKGPFINAKLLKRVKQAQKTGSKSAIRTYSRSSTIVPSMVNLNISVHNGRSFNVLYITQNMVGHKLGEFFLTRKHPSHSGDKKTKR